MTRREMTGVRLIMGRDPKRGKPIKAEDRVAHEIGEAFDAVRELIAVRHCRWCGADLNPAEATIDLYDHDGGWLIHESLPRKWLSIRCPGCRYDWSLVKLGVSTHALD